MMVVVMIKDSQPVLSVGFCTHSMQKSVLLLTVFLCVLCFKNNPYSAHMETCLLCKTAVNILEKQISGRLVFANNLGYYCP